MFSPDQYRLLDFGDGRRLECFAGLVLDRPCPGAERLVRRAPQSWAAADARFERSSEDQGDWLSERALPERWTIAWNSMRLELKPTQFGHLGIFPEQAANWEWIARQVRAAAAPLRVLNLFAYTGGSTLAAAAAGAEVTHVDAARNIVAWARRNAELSGLSAAPVRWITEDALKFVRRELRRGRHYDAVILDPPSYGHGSHGEVWRLVEHLPELLAICARLMDSGPRFLLLSAHTPGFGPERLRAMVAEAMGGTTVGQASANDLQLRSVAGQDLPSGSVVRWWA
jgi:23S rRNA (cytosine1962-C5)-methyltransferase